jgi:hypothetical protein
MWRDAGTLANEDGKVAIVLHVVALDELSNTAAHDLILAKMDSKFAQSATE